MRGPLWLLLDFVLPVHTSVPEITHTTSDLGLTGRATGVMPFFSHMRRQNAISFAVIKTRQGLTSCHFLLLPDNVLLLWFLAGRSRYHHGQGTYRTYMYYIYWLVPQLI